MKNNEIQSLYGIWISDTEGPTTQFENEKIMLEFVDDGRLIYTIISTDKDQKIFLTYQVENDVLITNQNSHPRKEETSFCFTSDGKLILIYGDKRSIYTKSA
ncbi:MAG: hypothetical protein Q8J62_10165 [Candidatus Cloacimonadaceae bacterium]|nr:hypothetical protein [Candidatus Cloacimonadaceae bacterium]